MRSAPASVKDGVITSVKDGALLYAGLGPRASVRDARA